MIYQVLAPTLMAEMPWLFHGSNGYANMDPTFPCRANVVINEAVMINQGYVALILTLILEISPSRKGDFFKV